MPAPFPDKPFVGMPGSEKSVEISRTEDRIVCCQASRTYRYSQAILVIFGLLLAYMAWGFWANPEGAAAPLFIRLLTLLFALALWFLFIRNLLGPPRIEVVISSGDLQFFRRRTARPVFIVRKQDVVGFDLTEQFYGSLGEEFWRNLVISVNALGGRRIALCASPDEKLMQSFAAELAFVLGVPLQVGGQ
ncbi:MAG TPA: hypothetical protein VKV95_16690 [Terriglobia bacterium]|nr:hypothetical protein [Terriglobia bacterium]